MLYRTIKTDTWRDPWFHALSPQSKCLFLYLFTNPMVSACGAMEITPGQIAFDTGIPAKKVAMELMAFQDKVLWLSDENVIVITNFYKHQRSQSSGNFTIAAKKAMVDLPWEARVWLGEHYPDLKDTHTQPLPIPSPTQGDKEEEELIATVVAEELATATEEETEDTPPLAKKTKPPNLDGFQDFYRLYPRRVKPADAERAWSKLKPDERQSAIEAIQRQVLWPSMTGDSQFIPYPATWINARSWEDEPPQIQANGRASPQTSRGTQTAEIFDELRRERGEPPADDPNVIDISSYQNGAGNERGPSQRGANSDRSVPVEAVRPVRQDGVQALPPAVHRRP